MRYLVLPLLLGALSAAAQTTRSVQPMQLWPELQGEVALRNGDYVLLALRGERSTQDGYGSSRRLGFDANRLTVGYEHFFLNNNWSLGATARLQSYIGGQQSFVPEVLVRHRSLVLGGFTFGQRLNVERTFPNNNGYVGGSGPDGQYWGRLRVDIERLYPVGSNTATGLALRPRLSYEASTHLRFQKETNDAEERTIQFTSLRGEVGVRLSPNIDFTPWFAYQTNYFETLPQYDKNNVQTSGGKLNLVYPTVGLDVRFTLIPSGTKEDRQQLPTQH
jgi:hypothetical protein